jgi:hypothetical protein
MSRVGVVGIGTRLRAGRTTVRIPVEARDSPLLRNVQTGSGHHPAYYSMGTGDLSLAYSDQRLKLTTHLPLLPRLRMGGATPMFRLYALKAWTETTCL